MVNKNVLVVDDQETVIEVIAIALFDGGFVPCIAKDGKTAIEEFRHYKPYLAIIDLKLEDGIGGVVLNEKLKDYDPLIFSVAMSGWFNELYSIAYLRRKKFDHFLEKPFRVDRLLRIANAARVYRKIWEEISSNKKDLETEVTEEPIMRVRNGEKAVFVN